MIKKTVDAHPLNSFMLVAAMTVGFCHSTMSSAGTYVFAGEANGENIVTHPSTYTGSGGVVIVRVCIDPASFNASNMEIPVQNNINIFNRLQPAIGNLKLGGTNNVPGGQIDFESVALHEIGHCLGMAHVNAASESGLTGDDLNYTKATDGANNTFDINPGADGVIGSSDDIRGDDGNLHWYRRSNNNPFTIDTVIDSTTYTRDLADLQGLGHSYATNADRAVASLLGVSNTEAVMQQGTFYDEAQRSLVHDDVATLLYAASGVDELSGTSDDYTIVLEYAGISASNCDVSLSITNTTGLAVCNIGGAYVSAPDHIRVTSPTIEFGNDFAWFFNTDTVNQAPVLNPVGDQVLIEAMTKSISLSGADADGDLLQYSVTGLPSFATLTDFGDGTANLDISPAVGDAGSYPVTLTLLDDGLPVLSAVESFTITIEVDSDGDGLSDVFETTVLGTDPNNADSDNDGLVDGAGGVVPLAALPGGVDVDGDGFVDGEQDLGTDPTLSDTDGDGISDGDEVSLYGIDPLLSNTGDVAPRGSPDNMTNAGDLVVLTRLVMGSIQPTAPEQILADINTDGVLDIADVFLLQRAILNGVAP